MSEYNNLMESDRGDQQSQQDDGAEDVMHRDLVGGIHCPCCRREYTLPTKRFNWTIDDEALVVWWIDDHGSSKHLVI